MRQEHPTRQGWREGKCRKSASTSLQPSFLGLVLVVGLIAGAASSAQVENGFSQTTCPFGNDGTVELSLKLIAEDQLMERALEGKSWSRSLVLEAVFPGQSEEPRELWRYDDALERAEFPPPELRARFICFQYGAGKDLHSLVFSWRAIEKGEWYEARVAVIRLRSSPLGNHYEVIWEKHIPKLPLAPHSVIWRASILQEYTFALIVLEGVRSPGGAVPPIIYVSLPEKSLFIHSGAGTERGNASKAKSVERDEKGTSEEEGP